MGGYPQEMMSFMDILFGYDIAYGSQKDSGSSGPCACLEWLTCLNPYNVILSLLYLVR